MGAILVRLDRRVKLSLRRVRRETRDKGLVDVGGRLRMPWKKDVRERPGRAIAGVTTGVYGGEVAQE